MIRTKRSREVLVLEGAAACRLTSPLQDRNFLVIKVDAEPFFLQLGGKSSKLTKIVVCAGSGGEDS